MDRPDTIYSLSDDALRADPWLEREDRSRLQPGAVGRGSLREICFLKRITPTGAVLSVESMVKPGERLDLELLTGDHMRGMVDWVRGHDVGLRFDDEADMFSLITRNLVHQPGDARRMPRIELECSAWLEADGRREIVKVLNLSDGGARIEAQLPLAGREAIVLTLDGFRPAPATVRWVQGRAAGIAFEPELPWQELMPWLRKRQRPRPERSGKAGSTAAAAPVQAGSVHARSVQAAPAQAAPAQAAPAQAAPTQAARAEAVTEEGFGLNLAARVRDGSRRWSIDVEAIDTRQIRFRSYAAVEAGRLFWISLPGLEGWPARVTDVDGYLITCVFTQPLHPAVLERILGAKDE